MFDHPKANPATSATPTPALYVRAAIFRAISAYAIPVAKNRTYTNTKLPARQFHPSTTCDATSGTINTANAPSATRSTVFPSCDIMSCVLPNDSHRLEKDPQREPEQSAPNAPVLPARVVKCLSHPLA